MKKRLYSVQAIKEAEDVIDDLAGGSYFETLFNIKREGWRNPVIADLYPLIKSHIQGCKWKGRFNYDIFYSLLEDAIRHYRIKHGISGVDWCHKEINGHAFNFPVIHRGCKPMDNDIRLLIRQSKRLFNEFLTFAKQRQLTVNKEQIDHYQPKLKSGEYAVENFYESNDGNAYINLKAMDILADNYEIDIDDEVSIEATKLLNEEETLSHHNHDEGEEYRLDFDNDYFNYNKWKRFAWKIRVGDINFRFTLRTSTNPRYRWKGWVSIVVYFPKSHRNEIWEERFEPCLDHISSDQLTEETAVKVKTQVEIVIQKWLQEFDVKKIYCQLEILHEENEKRRKKWLEQRGKALAESAHGSCNKLYYKPV